MYSQVRPQNPRRYGLMIREKKKILMKEGDADQFYVEKYIG